MKNKLLTVLTIIVLIFVLTSASYAADNYSVKLVNVDDYVYAPGIYNMSANATNTQDVVSYQWCARMGRSGGWMELYNSEAYSGMDTPNFRFQTADGLSNQDWASIQFGCRVTWKDGTVKYTEGTSMWILTYAKLLSDLAKDGIKMDSYGIRNHGSYNRTGDVLYYEISAGEEIAPYFNYPVLPNHYTELSEVTLKIECFVTENGKTKGIDPAQEKYSPYTLGRGNVQIRGDLVLYVNGKKMDVIDSKNIVVDVLTPEGIGEASAKQDISLKAERYNESGTVGRASKGERAVILEESGSWKKVACGGYIGWVPDSALEVKENIDFVYIAVPDPLDNAAPSFTADYMSQGTELFGQGDAVEWLNKSGNLLTASSRFASGNSYTVRFWVAAESGKRFAVSGGKPAVTAEVNGRKAKVSKAYEQSPDEVIWVEYTFEHVHDLKKVTQKNPTCTEPGKKLYYHCDCGADFEDYEGKIRIIDADWGIIPARGHWVSEWMNNGNYHYKVCQRRECGQTIEGTYGAHTGGVSSCVHQGVCSVCGASYGEKLAHNPGPAATEVSAQYCTECGMLLAEKLDHVHSLTEYKKKEPTCTDPGLDSYFHCEGCGKLFTGSKDALVQIDSLEQIILKPLGHTVSDNWKNDSQLHWRFCVVCGEDLGETKMIHADPDDDGLCNDCGFVMRTAASGPVKSDPAENNNTVNEVPGSNNNTEAETPVNSNTASETPVNSNTVAETPSNTNTAPDTPANSNTVSPFVNTDLSGNTAQNVNSGPSGNAAQNANASTDSDAAGDGTTVSLTPLTIALIAAGGVVIGVAAALIIKSSGKKKQG